MEYRRLGNSGLKVSALALGGWINFERKIAQREAERIVTTAYENGINFFDMADAYGYGEAEKWMGGMLKQFPRGTLVISTKVFWPMSDDVNDRGLSRKHLMESIDGSLRRLDTPYVDIYYCHRADPETPILETARAMDDLIRQGKVLYWGTSEWEADEIVEACDLCEKYGLYPPQAEQPEYSLLYRERVEREILPAAEPRGIGLTTFSPLRMGLLSGKYDDGVPDDSRFAKESWARESHLTDEIVEEVRALKPIADDLGITRAQLALAWTLHQPGVSSVITGATKVSQVKDNLGALEVSLSDDVRARIDDILR
jgi:voltage-dependent potassium channel beta subunit